MVKRIPVEEFVKAGSNTPILDVRSPSEYKEGHIPGAISFPLLSDEERAEVGTLYKQAGRATATERGMAIVGPKIKEMYQKGLSYATEGRLQVYCWRGGKRSESVADLLSLAGIDVTVLEKGYKAYRNWALSGFQRTMNLKIVGGATGSGKTDILRALRARGEQVADLEAMADHRGSTFGRLGMTRVITQQQFENQLAWELAGMQPGKPIWVEDESRNIGRQVIPDAFWIQMRSAPVYYIDIPLELRVRRLVEDYGHFSVNEIQESVNRIGERLGGLRMREVTEAIEKGDRESVAEMMLEYYDKTYAHGLGKRSPETIQKHTFDKWDADLITDRLLSLQ